MDKQIFNELYNEYYTTYEQIAAEKGYHPDDDFEKIQEMIADDLDDKSFSDDEIDEIISENPEPKTAYKFVAYALLLYSYYDTEEELIRVCKEKQYIDKLTNDDLANILMQRLDVDF